MRACKDFLKRGHEEILSVSCLPLGAVGSLLRKNRIYFFEGKYCVVVKRSYVFDAMSTIYKKMVSTIFKRERMRYIYGATDSREVLILNLV